MSWLTLQGWLPEKRGFKISYTDEFAMGSPDLVNEIHHLINSIKDGEVRTWYNFERSINNISFIIFSDDPKYECLWKASEGGELSGVSLEQLRSIVSQIK
jgi:hypothetical protein